MASAILIGAPGVVVTVEGPGVLRFLRDGRLVYAKSAALSSVDGALCGPGGAAITPRISLSDGFTIQPDGRVLVDGLERGRLVLALFPDEGALTKDGDYLSAQVRSNLGNPGEAGCGLIRTGSTGAAAVAQVPVAPKFEGEIVIQLRANTEIETERFTVGDVATIAALPKDLKVISAIDLGTTPPHGVRRVVDRARILSRVRYALGASDFSISGPLQASVVRKGQTVTHAQIEAIALKAALSESGANAQFRATGAEGDLSVPLGELRLIVESTNVNKSTATVRIGIHVDGERINSRSVRFDNISPIADIRVGEHVEVLVIASGASARTRGRVRSIDVSDGSVTVELDSGATLVGRVNAAGQVEVSA